MRFMNSYEIDEAQRRWASHPVLGPATQTLANLMDWTNSHSDGWAYWPKPARAAAKLMELIEGDGTYSFRDPEREDATPARLKAALSPIKAFRTRQKGADFQIVEELRPEPQLVNTDTRPRVDPEPGIDYSNSHTIVFQLDGHDILSVDVNQPIDDQPPMAHVRLYNQDPDSDVVFDGVITLLRPEVNL